MEKIPKKVDPIILARLDELCRNEPVDVVKRIIDLENVRASEFIRKYGRFVCQFEFYYDFLVRFNDSINYVEKDNWPKYRTIQWLILNYNLKSIYSAFNRLVRGFYDDSLILMRPSYEAFIKIVYISCFPTNPYTPLTSPKFSPKDGSRTFNLTNFLKDLSLDWGEYELLSAISHSSAFRVLEHVKEHIKGEKIPVGISLPVDKEMEEIGINYLSFLVYIYLKVLEMFATGTSKPLTTEMLNKAKELIDLRKDYFATHQKEYWPKVMNDIDDLFQLMEGCDNNKDWKELWDDIRKK